VVIPRDPALARAYDYCAHMAREHYENFPVASRLLPRSMRPHIAAIYAFARRADDFADEGALEPEHRLRLLDDWGHRLRAAAAGRPPHDAGTEPLAFKDDGLVFDALADTIRACRLPVSLFEDLLSAFRQDVTTTRYATWADVLDYCRRSANPVGRLVLRVSGRDRPELDAVSDAVCTALQLTNFWQDLGRDWHDRNRLYVPQDEMAQAGALERDLTDGRLTGEWRGVLSSLIARTRDLFFAGRTVADHVSGRLRWELRVTWLGGMRILQKVDDARQRSFDERPTLTAGDAAVLLRDAVLWTR
jgi:squalene synthase HpnC